VRLCGKPSPGSVQTILNDCNSDCSDRRATHAVDADQQQKPMASAGVNQQKVSTQPKHQPMMQVPPVAGATGLLPTSTVGAALPSVPARAATTSRAANHSAGLNVSRSQAATSLSSGLSASPEARGAGLAANRSPLMQMADGSTRMHPAERGLMPGGLGQGHRNGAQPNGVGAGRMVAIGGAGRLPGQSVGPGLSHAGAYTGGSGPVASAGMRPLIQGHPAYGMGGAAAGGTYL
jgi:hypothetical protein